FGNIQREINNAKAPQTPLKVECNCSCTEAAKKINSNELGMQQFYKYEEAKMIAEAREQFKWSAMAFASTTAVITTFSIRLYFPAIALLPLSIMGRVFI